jgi:hypothetical protein
MVPSTLVDVDPGGWRGDLGRGVARARPMPGGIGGWDNASLPRVAQGRKKVGLTVQYSGFAAFGHPARQVSLADRT